MEAKLKERLHQAGGVGAKVTDVTEALDGVYLTFDDGGIIGTVRTGYPKGGGMDEATLARWTSAALAILQSAMPAQTRASTKRKSTGRGKA